MVTEVKTSYWDETSWAVEEASDLAEGVADPGLVRPIGVHACYRTCSQGSAPTSRISCTRPARRSRRAQLRDWRASITTEQPRPSAIGPRRARFTLVPTESNHPAEPAYEELRANRMVPP